jgi:hypothetical protein
VCEDELHYWPSERCAAPHEGRELEPGWFCYPGFADYYCSWMGSCAADGSECLCFDAEHRKSEDRCLTYTPFVNFTSSPAWSPTDDSVCSPLSREFCNHRGYCNENGDGCVCDDVLHYWPSENCAQHHLGRELEEDWCCFPDTVDYYCSWLGTCASDGSTCLCFDPEHRLPAERCADWHLALTTPEGQCPLLGNLFPTPAPVVVTGAPTIHPGTHPTPQPVQHTASPIHAPTAKPTSLSTTLSPTRAPSGAPVPSTSRSPASAPSPAPVAKTLPTAAPAHQVCIPRDRKYCNNRGYCSAAGDGCVCDDELHYWPSERCAAPHEGRELEPGWFCYPGFTDYYCSWIGTCAADGLSCSCSEYPHRTSADRCYTWREVPGGCNDRSDCSYRGMCVLNACECSDSEHYWSSECQGVLTCTAAILGDVIALVKVASALISFIVCPWRGVSLTITRSVKLHWVRASIMAVMTCAPRCSGDKTRVSRGRTSHILTTTPK